MASPELHWKGLAVARTGRRADPLLLAVAALSLAGGLAYARSTAPGERAVRAHRGAIRLTLPPGWAGGEARGVYTARRASLESAGPTVTVRAVAAPEAAPSGPPAGGEFLMGAAPVAPRRDPALSFETQLARMEAERSASGSGHRVLAIEEKRSFGGRRSTWSHFAIVRDPPGARPGAAVVPLVFRGVDVLVARRDGGFWQVSAEAPAVPGGALDPELVRILAGLRVSP